MLMLKLALAFYAEGVTDHQFLPTIIRRTSRQICDRHGLKSIDVLPVESIVFNKAGLRQDERILQAALTAFKSHILIIHADADDHTPENALRNRFQPGYERVQQLDTKICKNLVPVVPIYMTEAWMLADADALQEVIEIDIKPHELGLPKKAKQVELYADPKQMLRQVVQKAYAHKTRRQRHMNIEYLYEALAREIRLDRLAEVPAYQRFAADLTTTLRTLNFIQ
jgi:hypothetical protein